VIGGRIVDPSALAALLHGNLVVRSWLGAALSTGMTIWIPELARTEVETLYPRTAAPQLQLLAEHPQVLFAEPIAADAAAAVELLDQSAAFDAAAALVVHAARQRGWPVLTADPHRLLRLDPNITVESI
jgi:hypothetical protein